MFERDYLIRLLNQAGVVLGKALKLREQSKHQDALTLIDEFLGKELRLRSGLALGLSDEDLLAMLSVTGTPNAESVAVVAALLQKEGELYADLDRLDESIPRFSKALRLDLYLIRRDMEIEGLDIHASISELLEYLSSYQLDGDTLRALWEWREAGGQFAEAEDLIYELFEAGGLTPEEGEAFYERLAQLDPALLEGGGLSIEELEEGCRQWSTLVKEKSK